jgi:uncharacterized protein (DUF1800 family)
VQKGLNMTASLVERPPLPHGDGAATVGATIGTSRFVAIAGTALVASLLAACGGGGGGSSPTPAPPPVAIAPPPPVAPPPPSGNEVVRLLDQAAFGPNDASVAAVQAQGVTAWVDAQLATPTTGYATLPFIDANSAIGCPTGSASTCGRDNYSAFPLQVQFFKNAMTAPDQLRQRVAFAYSQIFVISSIDIHPTYGVRQYQQMLLDNAFVNYRQLIERVTLHPAMGDYLDMVNNDKPNAAGTVQANENYAREVLQLFSIGLSKLNADGTAVKDANGVAVPSYDQSVVTAFARAFTGWTYAPLTGATSHWTNTVNYIGDMVPFDAHHDVATKVLLNGATIPAGQNATQDLASALDTIYNHPNIGTFIGRQLIQALVTSNPTPAYIARITAVFNDNGSGVRGDMKAVVRAILLDTEARGDVKTDLNYGKLRDPAVYAASVARAFGGTSDGVYLAAQAGAMGQSVYTPGSVFSFYPPDYALPSSASLLGPQFGTQNTTTSVAQYNYVFALLNTTNGIAADTSVPGSTGTQVNLAALQALAATPSTMVDKLDALMTHTTLTTTEKNAIVTAVNAVAATDTLGRARMAAYLVAASPRYQINR